MYELYMIVNDVNDKVYIGITSIGVRERWYAHLSSARYAETSHNNNPMYEDMRRYGESHFRPILLESDISIEDRDRKEREAISRYNSYIPNGYNLTLGGFDNRGVQWDASRGEKISRALKGVPKSKEHREALSKSRTGRFTKEDNPFYQKHHTQVTKSKLSDANTKYSVIMYTKDGDPVKEFKNIQKAAEYLTANGFATSKKGTCACRLYEVCNKYDDFNHTAYGFCWRFKKSND